MSRMIELLRSLILSKQKMTRRYPSIGESEQNHLNEVLVQTFRLLGDVVQTGSSNFRADDWIRTSMDPLTRRTPFSVEPHRREKAIVVRL